MASLKSANGRKSFVYFDWQLAYNSNVLYIFNNSIKCMCQKLRGEALDSRKFVFSPGSELYLNIIFQCVLKFGFTYNGQKSNSFFVFLNERILFFSLKQRAVLESHSIANFVNVYVKPSVISNKLSYALVIYFIHLHYYFSSDSVQMPV